MSILDSLFGASAPAAQTAQTAPAEPVQPATLTPTEPLAPTEASIPEIPAEPDAGMDKFKDLWDTTPEDAGNLQDAANFDVDPAKLMEEVGKVDFTQVVTPELMQKVTGGGEDAMQAMMQAMNLMSQATYAQSAAAASAITKAAYSRAEAGMEARIAKQINASDVHDGIITENPALKHKAAQPIIAALNSQIAAKFPNATSSERVAMAKQYLTEFASIANPTVAPTVTPSPEDMDWEAFII